MEKRYFLFGPQRLIEDFEDHSLDGLESYTLTGFSVGLFVSGDNPDSMMALTKEYGNYAEISEKDYQLIVERFFPNEITES
jgi:hypothetical protein